MKNSCPNVMILTWHVLVIIGLLIIGFCLYRKGETTRDMSVEKINRAKMSRNWAYFMWGSAIVIAVYYYYIKNTKKYKAKFEDEGYMKSLKEQIYSGPAPLRRMRAISTTHRPMVQTIDTGTDALAENSDASANMLSGNSFAIDEATASNFGFMRSGKYKSNMCGERYRSNMCGAGYAHKNY